MISETQSATMCDLTSGATFLGRARSGPGTVFQVF